MDDSVKEEQLTTTNELTSKEDEPTHNEKEQENEKRNENEKAEEKEEEGDGIVEKTESPAKEVMSSCVK